jgi:thymidine kinase
MPPKTCIFTGPMFARKTTNLLKCWHDVTIPKLAFKFSNDIRYENTEDNENNSSQRQIVSHDDNILPAIGITNCMEINSYVSNDSDKIAIFIDEGQFFQDIKQWLLDFAHESISQVYISGLDYDIFGNKFNPDFNDLMDSADECHTLVAKCYICNEPANYTQFIDNNSISKLEGNILIGGSEQYQPACTIHFIPFGPAKNN